MGLTREELEFLRTYMEEKAVLVEGPAHLAVKAAGISYIDVADMFYKANSRGEFHVFGPFLPWKSMEEFAARKQEVEIGTAKRTMPLTPEEKLHCDHIDFENTHLGTTELAETPALDWHRVNGYPMIENILTLRREERKDVMFPEKPLVSFAPAWKSAYEARSRDAELAAEVERLKSKT